MLTLLAALMLQAPPKRAHHAMGYDEARRRVILTGGSTPVDSGRRFEFFNDLWAWDGTRWTRLSSSGDQMSGMRLAWDTRRGRLLSFGGFDDTGASRADFRALEGDAWQPLSPNEERAAEPGFVFDTRRNRAVAFGGTPGRFQVNGATWEFDGTAWTRFAGTNPPARSAHAMAYDTRRGVTIVFGGFGAPAPNERPPLLADLWEFDGAAWRQRATGTSPPARHSAGVAWDSRRNRLVVFGGIGSDGFLGDTWAYDGTTWTRLADTGPSPRVMGYMAYDAARDRVVLFGGRRGYPNGDLDDTWEFDGTAWHRMTH